MSKVRLKNIGVTSKVWKELKLLSVEKEWTMDEVVADLLEIRKQHLEKMDRKAESS
ncbi:TPA: hypothetical protein QDZ28_000637 [Pseudomonas putida]|nr:hypothetical protein [Pseudomonas putida]